MNKEFVIVDGIFAIFFLTYATTCGITYRRRLKRNVELALSRFPLMPQVMPFSCLIVAFAMKQYFPSKPIYWYASAITIGILAILWTYKFPEEIKS